MTSNKLQTWQDHNVRNLITLQLVSIFLSPSKKKCYFSQKLGLFNMLLLMNLVSVLATIPQFFPEGAAAEQRFTSKPLNPTYVLEDNNLTFEWGFTLGNDRVNFVNVIKVSGNRPDLIGTTTSRGELDVKPRYVGRARGKVSNSTAEVTFLGIKRSDKGIYRLDVYPVDSGYLFNDVSLIVQSPASFTNISGNQTVPEGTNVLLFCNTSGSPLPKITWVRESQNRCDILQKWADGTACTLRLDDIRPTDAGTYMCIADNKVGIPVSHTLGVAVLFLDRHIIMKDKYYVDRGQTAYLYCHTVGYPQPTITWSPCSPKDVCDKSFLNISNVQTGMASYSCEASNSEGHVSANTTLIIGGRNIYLRLMITDEECTPGDQSFWEKLKPEVNKIFTGKNGYNGTRLLDFRCGSIIVDLVLTFNDLVAEDVIISTLRNAIIKNGKLGELRINVSSIVGIPPFNTSTAATPTSKTTPKPDDNKTLIIVVSVIGVVIGVVVLLVVVIVGVPGCIRKKNKSKVHAGDHDGDPGRAREKGSSNEVEMEAQQVPGEIQDAGVVNGNFQATREAPSLHTS